MRTVLFHRKYRRFHGGHLKVWHYFNHVLAAPALDARVVFDVDSSWDSSNPWQQARERVVESAEGITPDALFIAGRDWQRFEKLGLLDLDVPKLNLIQHMRHADEWSIQSRYLDRKAIRICVSGYACFGTLVYRPSDNPRERSIAPALARRDHGTGSGNRWGAHGAPW